jgi:PAS domain S-box-containing protein
MDRKISLGFRRRISRHNTITPRIQAPSSQQQDKYLALLLENVSDAIIASDAQYRLTAWNTAAENMYGWKASEVLGKPGLTIVQTQFVDADKETVLRSIAATGRYRGEATQARKDGSRFAVELSSIVLRDEQGKITGYVSVNRDISTRKTAEEQVRASNERFEALFHNVPLQGVIYRLIRDPQGEIVDWEISEINPLGAASIGQEPVQLIGRRTVELFGPDVMAPYLETSREVMKTGQPRQFETHFDTNDRHYLSAVFPVGADYYANVSIDITDLRKSQQLLQVQLERIRALHRIDRTFIADLDSTFSIQHLLVEIHAQLEADAVSVLLWNVDRRLLEHYGDHGFRTPAIRRSKVRLGNAAAGQADGTESVIHIPNLGEVGSRFSRAELLREEGLREYFGVPLVVKGQLKGILEVFYRFPRSTDEDWLMYLKVLGGQVGIALEKLQLIANLQRTNFELESRVEARTAELHRTNLYLEKANRSKDEFLASMSHELRTPLTGILGLSEALELNTYGSLNPKQTSIMKLIESSGQHLLELINDILDLSKLEARKFELELQPVSLSEVCQAAVHLVKGLAHQKQQNLSCSIQPEGIYIQSDPRRIKQILVNLLSNAVKYSPNGRSIGLEVLGNETDQVLYLTVWDNGIGIQPDDLERIFLPFVQIDSSLSRQQSGTGLGLALVKDLVNLMGGEISVQSTFGEGSRFTVTFPWIPALPVYAGAKSTTAPLENALRPPENADPSSQEVMVAMVVDDNQQNITFLSEFLASIHIRVEAAESGWQFLERVERAAPDIVLMDIQMPGIDGLETIRRLRAYPNPRTAAVPVIALTALAMRGDREKCLAAGANEYISKPYSLLHFQQIIKEVCAKNGAVVLPQYAPRSD